MPMPCRVNDDDASSSIEAPMSSTESGEEAMLGETGEKSGDGSDEELQEVYENAEKGKTGFQKEFSNIQGKQEKSERDQKVTIWDSIFPCGCNDS